MIETANHELVYEELAGIFERRRQPDQRDKFLLLAADAALAAGQHDHAERLRARLLQFSPFHELRLHRSFQEALRSKEIRGYLVDLRRQFPPEVASQLAQELGPPPTGPQMQILRSGNEGNHLSPLPPPQRPAQSPREASRAVRLPGEKSDHLWLIHTLVGLTALAGMIMLGYAVLGPWLR